MSPMWFFAIYMIGSLVALFCVRLALPHLFKEAETNQMNGTPNPYRRVRRYMIGGMLLSWIVVIALAVLYVWFAFLDRMYPQSNN